MRLGEVPSEWCRDGCMIASHVVWARSFAEQVVSSEQGGQKYSRKLQHSLSEASCMQSMSQDKRSLKMGLDFGLSLGKKVNHNATVDNETTKKVAEGEGKTRAFTISK